MRCDCPFAQRRCSINIPLAKSRAAAVPSAKAPALSPTPSIPAVSAASAWIACLSRYAPSKGKQEFRIAPPCPGSTQCERGSAPKDKQDGFEKGAIAARDPQCQIGMGTVGSAPDGIRKNDGLDCRFSGPVIGARTWSEFLETGNQII